MPFTPTPITGSQVGIVYSTVNKHVRQHIYVDSDTEWPAITAFIQSQPGLSITFVPMASHLAGHDQFHADIATAVGLPTIAQQWTDPICAVIDNTTLLVESLIMADAMIDTVPGKTLINDQQVQVGHSWSPTTKQFTSVQTVLPPKPGRATAVTVPANSWSPSGTIGTATAALPV